MKLFDGHCDTAYELWTRGEGLERNFNDLNCSAVEIMVTHNRDLF